MWAVSDGLIYAEERRSVYAVDSTTFDGAWHASYDSISKSVSVSQGVVYAVGSGGEITAFDAATGVLHWRLDLRDVVPTSDRCDHAAPVIVDGTIYLRCIAEDTPAMLYAIGGDRGANAVPVATPPVFIEVGTTLAVGPSGAQMHGAPSPDSVVVEELAAGIELVVSGPAVIEGAIVWWPVENPATGSTGYVSAEHVAVKT